MRLFFLSKKFFPFLYMLRSDPLHPLQRLQGAKTAILLTVDFDSPSERRPDSRQGLPIPKGHAVDAKRNTEGHPLPCRHPIPFYSNDFRSGTDDIQSFTRQKGARGRPLFGQFRARQERRHLNDAQRSRSVRKLIDTRLGESRAESNKDSRVFFDKEGRRSAPGKERPPAILDGQAGQQKDQQQRGTAGSPHRLPPLVFDQFVLKGIDQGMIGGVDNIVADPDRSPTGGFVARFDENARNGGRALAGR